ncbi:MAG: hypothetical protein LBU24_03905 [Methanocalculaceae archaeon]|jgi:phenylacetate-CoA ligase|nr:hypothetical protein [Methanocalculaceae archaeon]
MEIIDPNTGEILGLEEKGKMVITSLVKEALPLFRYRTSDITMLMEDYCACGSGQKIARLPGRSGDMLTASSINVFPSQIEHVLKNIPEVGDQFRVYFNRINHLEEIAIEAGINKYIFPGGLSDLSKLQNKNKGLHNSYSTGNPMRKTKRVCAAQDFS